MKQDPDEQGKETRVDRQDSRSARGRKSAVKPRAKTATTSRKTATRRTAGRATGKASTKATTKASTRSTAKATRKPPKPARQTGAADTLRATTQRLHHPVAPETVLMAVVDALRPTQITVGAFHVAQKIHVTRRLAERKRATFLLKHPVHVVIGPGETMYVVDHHHWVKAWHDLGIEQVPVIVRKDLSRLSVQEFWRYMVKHHQVHPYDEHGRRRPLAELPRGVQGMRDDPYRSLEAFAQRAGAYRKVKTAYPDFRWADFFRKEIDGPFDTPHGFAVALVKAVQLAHSHAARDLPGYMGKEKFCE